MLQRRSASIGEGEDESSGLSRSSLRLKLLYAIDSSQ